MGRSWGRWHAVDLAAATGGRSRERARSQFGAAFGAASPVDRRGRGCDRHVADRLRAPRPTRGRRERCGPQRLIRIVMRRVASPTLSGRRPQFTTTTVKFPCIRQRRSCTFGFGVGGPAAGDTRAAISADGNERTAGEDVGEPGGFADPGLDHEHRSRDDHRRRYGTGRTLRRAHRQRDRVREHHAGQPAVGVGHQWCRQLSIQGFATDISVDQGEHRRLQDRHERLVVPPRHLPHGLLRRRRRPSRRHGHPDERHAASPAASTTRRPASSTAATGPCARRGTCRPTRSRASTSPSSCAPTARRARATSSSSSATTTAAPTCCSRPSDTTWQAYNDYGGNSLYAGAARRAAPTRSATTGRSRRATTRPRTGSSTPSTRWSAGSRPTATTSATPPGVDTDRLGAELLEHERLPVGRPRRVLVGQPARQRRGGARRRCAPRVLQRQRGLLEDPLGEQHRRIGHAVPHAGLLQGDRTTARRSTRPPDLDRHLARPALQPAGRRRPARERADRHDLHGQLLRRSTWWSAPRTARCASGATPASPTLTGGQTTTVGADIVGYEWDEDLDNGFRPDGLFRLSRDVRREPGDPPRRRFDLRSGVRHPRDDDVPRAQRCARLRRRHACSGRGASTASTIVVRRTRPTSPPSRRRSTCSPTWASSPRRLQAGLVAGVASTDAVAPTSTISTPVGRWHGARQQQRRRHRHGDRRRRRGRRHRGVGRRRRHLAPRRRVAPTGRTRSTRPRRVVDDPVAGDRRQRQHRIAVVPASRSSVGGTGVVSVLDLGCDGNARIARSCRIRTRSRSVSCSRWPKRASSPGSGSTRRRRTRERTSVSLWTSTGSLLGSVTFTGESGSGWQQADFGNPIPVDCGHDVCGVVLRAERSVFGEFELLHARVP